MQYHPETVVSLHSLGLNHLVIDRVTSQILAAFEYINDADDYFADPRPNMARADIVETGIHDSSDPWKGLAVQLEEQQ